MRVEVVRRLAEMRQFSPEMAQKVAWCCTSGWKDGVEWAEIVLGIQGSGGDVERLEQMESKGILEEIETE